MRRKAANNNNVWTPKLCQGATPRNRLSSFWNKKKAPRRALRACLLLRGLVRAWWMMKINIGKESPCNWTKSRNANRELRHWHHPPTRQTPDSRLHSGSFYCFVFYTLLKPANWTDKVLDRVYTHASRGVGGRFAPSAPSSRFMIIWSALLIKQRVLEGSI